MGTDGRGITSEAALQKASTWGTAVEAGAGDGVRINSSSGGGGKEVIEDNSLAGVAFGSAPNIGQEVHRKSVSLDFRYAGRCPEILAYAMGTAGAPSEVEAGLEYTHALSFESRLGDFFTWSERKGSDGPVWEYDSCKLSRLVIEVSGRGPAQMEMEFLGSSLLRDDTSTNTIATSANWTVLTPIVPIFLGDCRFRLNGQAAGALGSGDVLKPNLIRLTIDRGLSEEFLADQAVGRAICEPEEEGDVGVYLQLGFPEYLGDTYASWVDSGTAKKADLYITNAAAALTGAASGLFHEYDFDFPHLVPVERPENALRGPERIEDGITFRSIIAASNPTGMSSTNMVCSHRNQVNTNLLA